MAFSGFFWARKACLWQNIVWAAYSLQISSDESLWPCRVHKHRVLQDFTIAVKMIDVIGKKQMHDSVITG